MFFLRSFNKDNQILLIGITLLILTIFNYWFALFGACAFYFSIGTLSYQRKKLTGMIMIYIGSLDSLFLIFSFISYSLGIWFMKYYTLNHHKVNRIPNIKPIFSLKDLKIQDIPNHTPKSSLLASRTLNILEKEIYDKILISCSSQLHRQIPHQLKDNLIIQIQSFIDEFNKLSLNLPTRRHLKLDLR